MFLKKPTEQACILPKLILTLGKIHALLSGLLRKPQAPMAVWLEVCVGKFRKKTFGSIELCVWLEVCVGKFRKKKSCQTRGK